MAIFQAGRRTGPADCLAIAFAIAPLAVVLQYRAVAPIATVALLAAVLLHRRHAGRWPRPHGTALLAALALFAWAALSAAWALEPARALLTAVQIGGFILLGAAAAQAVAEEPAEARARLLRWAAGGLALGLAAALADALTGNALRATARGMRQASPGLVYGLKPAASAMALWLPLVAAAPLHAGLRGALLAGGAAVLLGLPGDAARIAVLVAMMVGGCALLAPRWTPRLLGLGLAAALLLMPVLLGPVLARGFPAGGWPPSAAHRLLIWDFAIQRIAERPLLGWGMDASRAMPGHRDPPSPALLARFGLDGPGTPSWLPRAEILPLHPHNGALQLWLELGLVGALLGAGLALLLGLACAGGGRASAIRCAMLASGAVTALLSFGAWQEWWIGTALMAVAGAAALPALNPVVARAASPAAPADAPGRPAR